MNTSTNNPSSTLISLCADASRQMAALENFLQQEKQILLSDDPFPLESIQQEKQRLLASMELFLKKRGELLNKLGYTGNHKGWKKWQHEKLRDPSEVNLCQSLEQSFHRCQTLNDTNGKAIARQQQTVNKLLSIIRGQRPTQPSLYTSRGHVDNGGSPKAPISA